jgi:hypothetical protein
MNGKSGRRYLLVIIFRHVSWFLSLLVLLLGSASLTDAQTGGIYDLTWWTIDGGGSGGGIGITKLVQGGVYELRSTANQPDAEKNIVSGGQYTLFSGFWPGEAAVINRDIFLPIIMKTSPPDLIGSFTLSPNQTTFTAGQPVLITVVVTNTGGIATEAFWVDFYINPSTLPKVNLPWNKICGLTPCYGLAWYISNGLGPGQSITLTSASGGYTAAQSLWPGFFAAGTSDLYLYVDSWNPTVSTGGVFESNETNNRAELHGVVVTGLDAVEIDLPSAADLPLRPAP